MNGGEFSDWASVQWQEEPTPASRIDGSFAAATSEILGLDENLSAVRREHDLS
jgi:hypothetical protein